jgi:Na+(H+)/acetate symporter ActP
MRSRVLALASVLAVAAGPALVVAPAVAKTTTKHHAGQACSAKKKAPKGFMCKKNSKGKYVLVKSK